MEEMKRARRDFAAGVALLAAFALWTALVQLVDVQPVGQRGTNVGFAALNTWLHGITGVHMALYTATDWLGLVPVAVCLGVGALGGVQLVGRRSLRAVDADLLLLGVHYILVASAYLIFEMMPVNYRPILLDGVMEASYPSSTTLLVLGVMPTLGYQIRRRSDSPSLRRVATVFVTAFSVLMVVGRLVSGVHWATDIVGSVLLAAGLLALYRSAVVCVDVRLSAR